MFYAESDIEVLYIRLFESTLYLRWWNWKEILCLYLHEKIVGGRNRFDHLVQKNDLFLYFSLYSGLSLEILMFFIFCRNVLNACDSPASMSEVHGGGWKWFGQVHEPWNSMEPTMTNPRNEAHSLDRASHMHSDLYDKKWKISKCQEIVPNKVENREKKTLLLNQMVKTITPTDNFLM